MRSHLIYDDNLELNKAFEDIEKREPVHNNKVSVFMSTIDDKIKNSITNKDDMPTGGCDIDHIASYDSGPETRTPNCILRHTVFYYRDKAQNDNLNFGYKTIRGRE
jgi:hypothetical protein